MKYLNDKKIRLFIQDHPPQSPDLNPIDNLWNHVKRQINRNNKINGVEDIWNAFEEEWKGIKYLLIFY